MGRYHYPLPETAAVQSVGLPWQGFKGRILDGSRFQKKNRSRHGKGGIIAHYCAISPSQTPFIAYNIAQYIFTTTPFIEIKYWQYLVRANR